MSIVIIKYTKFYELWHIITRILYKLKEKFATD